MNGKSFQCNSYEKIKNNVNIKNSQGRLHRNRITLLFITLSHKSIMTNAFFWGSKILKDLSPPPFIFVHSRILQYYSIGDPSARLLQFSAGIEKVLGLGLGRTKAGSSEY